MSSAGVNQARPRIEERQSSGYLRLRFAPARTESPTPIYVDILNGESDANLRGRRPEREEDQITATGMGYLRNLITRNDKRRSDPLPSLRYDDEPPAYDQSLIYSDDSDEDGDDKDGEDHAGHKRTVQKIQYNPSLDEDNKRFLIKMSRAMMLFGAPSHRVEAHLSHAAKVLRVNASFVYLPGNIICSFRHPITRTGETHYVKGPVSALALGKLHQTHQIYRHVTHDEMSAKEGSDKLDELLAAPPEYSNLLCCLFTFLMTLIICPMAFGGSVVDMWAAGMLALLLGVLQTFVASKSIIYADVFEITTASLISFIARGLSSIRVNDRQLFCYTAISSSSIITLLPGFLILCGGLEIASKKMLSGSVKLVYALIFSLFLGFGLQIGSDLFLLFHRDERARLEDLARYLTRSVTYDGSFVPINGSTSTTPINGTWTFMNMTTAVMDEVVNNCHRPVGAPLYLRPFPKWTEAIFVPIFATLGSLASLQPWRSRELLVMVSISCLSYILNFFGSQYWFERPETVAAVSASVVGVLGNVYARMTGGTAFTAMVGGVGFLVPSVFAETGGITAEGNGIDIGGKILEVTIGIVVGLFISQTMVYKLGAAKKGAAAWSF